MAQCSSCGEVLTEGSKFCVRCGTPATAPQIVMACAKCGATIAPGKRFCTACGTPVGAMPPSPRQQTLPTPPPPSSRIPPPNTRPPMPAAPPFTGTSGMPAAGGPPQGFPTPPTAGAYPHQAPVQPHAGSFAATPQAMPASMPSPARKRSGALLVTVLLLGIFVALAAGGYLAYRHLTAVPDGEQQATTNDDDQANDQQARTTTRGITTPNGEQAVADRAGTASATRARNATRSGRPSATPRNAGDARTPNSPAGKAASEATPAMPQGWELPAGSATNDAAISVDNPAITTAGRRSAQPLPEPLSGVVIWSGQLRKNDIITIDGETTNTGMVRGQLPGIPVTLNTPVKDVRFTEMPGPANGWKRFSMQAIRNRKVVVTLHWRALE